MITDDYRYFLFLNNYDSITKYVSVAELTLTVDQSLIAKVTKIDSYSTNLLGNSFLKIFPKIGGGYQMIYSINAQ